MQNRTDNEQEHRHSVQFYWDDDCLLGSLSEEIASALNAGGAAVAIATPPHIVGLNERLRGRGVDTSGAINEGRYLIRDVGETLASFMVDGWPNESRFQEVISEAVTRAALKARPESPRLFAFGEMVALLWAQGMSQAALRLEEMWNELIQRQGFALHCAYPMNAFRGPDDSESFRRVCEAHSSVTPANRAAQFSEDNYRRALAIMQQTTEALESEKALRQSEQKFRLLVDSVQDYAIFMLDRDGNVATWNQGARRIKGYSAAEIIGRHFSCFYPEEDIRSGKPEMELRVASQCGRFEDEGWRLRQDGSRFWANVIITALKDENGNTCGFSKVTRDITERMRAQETLRENRDALRREVDERMAAETKLQDSESSLRTLSRNLFRVQDEERRHVGRELHDTIGQYLSALKMELDSLLFEPGLQDKGVRRQMGTSIELLEQCIKEVRTMSYLLYPPLLEEMGLKMAVPWYIDGFGKRSGIKTRLELPRDFGRLPRNVELVLFRVLQECLTNVHRHSGSPTALIRVFVENGIAVMEINDAGKGLPTGVLEFGQKGTYSPGIGLRSMSERVRDIGGKLELSSAGNGTTVRASVPCSTSAPEARTIQ